MHGLNLVVVGGGSGLGAEVARRAATEGAAGVAVLDLDGAAAQGVAADVASVGTASVHATCDVRDRAGTHAAVAAATERLGGLDAMVVAAAVYPRRPLLEIGDDDWEQSLAVNVRGTYNAIVAAVAHMRGQPRVDGVRGRIVTVSSVDAFRAHPQNAHYAATKAAVVSLTRSFAAALAPDGVLVNGVAPAAMATDRARRAGFLDELAAANPLGRAAEPAEIAAWVLMAAGPRNTYMTGETVIVSGGYLYG